MNLGHIQIDLVSYISEWNNDIDPWFQEKTEQLVNMAVFVFTSMKFMVLNRLQDPEMKAEVCGIKLTVTDSLVVFRS
jgi:hypothetical protein